MVLNVFIDIGEGFAAWRKRCKCSRNLPSRFSDDDENKASRLCAAEVYARFLLLNDLNEVLNKII